MNNRPHMDSIERAKSEVKTLVRVEIEQARERLRLLEKFVEEADRKLQEAVELRDQECRRIEALRVWLEVNP